MTQDLFLRRKWTLRAHGQQVVFVERANERTAHVIDESSRSTYTGG